MVINGKSGSKKDIYGGEIYVGAEITLVHELIHVLRGEYGLKSGVGGDKEEEAYVIQLENTIRERLGYGLRGDGSEADDVNGDGIGDGDGSYGEYGGNPCLAPEPGEIGDGPDGTAFRQHCQRLRQGLLLLYSTQQLLL